jgi:hypothetical protein
MSCRVQRQAREVHPKLRQKVRNVMICRKSFGISTYIRESCFSIGLL